MADTRWDGAVVPTAYSDLLGAWGRFSDSVGTFVRVASMQEARARLAQAPAGVVTSASPAMFLIGGVLYSADGSKTGGDYNIVPVSGYSGVLVDHWDKSDGRGRPTSDHTTRRWGQSTFQLPVRSLLEFSLDVCVSIVHSDFGSEDEKNKANGSYYFGFLLDNVNQWQTELQYNRTFMTHHLSWKMEADAGTHTAAYTTTGSYGTDPYWHFDGGVYPGTRFRVFSLGATD